MLHLKNKYTGFALSLFTTMYTLYASKEYYNKIKN